MFISILFNIIHNSQKVKTTQMSINDKGVNKCGPSNETLLSLEKDGQQVAGALKVYAQERKSDSENPTLYGSIHRKHPNRETHRRK